MRQMASLLAVATVFTGLRTQYVHFTVREGGAYTRDQTTYVGN